MILVVTGTWPHPFQRLADIAGTLARRSDVVLQHGPAQPPTVLVAFPYASEAVIAQYMRQAEIVICHGGAGSIARALSLGHQPIVVPRQRDLGENIDDHQVVFAQRLAERGLIKLCSNIDEIAPLPTTRTPEPRHVGASPSLVASLIDLIGERLPDRIAASQTHD